MTICIMAVCESGKAIVSASDREFGIDYTSAEFEDAKIHPLFPPPNRGSWSVAIAGTVSHATEVMARMRLIDSTPKTRLETRNWSDIQGLMEKAYRKVRVNKAEGEILAPRGWTLEKFQNDGAKLLPSATYANIDTRLSLYDLGASLIVGGFDDDNMPIILTVRNPGVVTDHSKLAFWCIGSGSTLAQTNMFSRSYSWSFSLEKAAYMVYEAKRNSERAIGVGRKQTDIAVITRKGGGRLPQPVIRSLEEIFEELKPKEFAEDHQTKLANIGEFRNTKASF
jgi:20S proteasome alpha/beta subunit